MQKESKINIIYCIAGEGVLLFKIELIGGLSISLKSEKKKKERDFYKSFGAFASKKSSEEIKG